METKKKITGAVWLFTALILIYEIVSVLAWTTDIFEGITIKQNILLSQSLIFVPTVIYLILKRKNINEIIRFRKFHPLSLLILPILLIAMEPCVVLINAISMLFVENQISDVASALVGSNSIWVSLFYMAFLPCVVEELAYRGVMLGSFRDAGRIKAILASGFLFGLMHMNLNQMAYAIFIGIVFGLVVEATGSIIPTMILHFLFNGLSVLMQHFSNVVPALQSETEETVLSKGTLLMMIHAYLPFAIIGAVIAYGCIVLLAWLNKRKDSFLAMFPEPFHQYDSHGEKIKIFIPLLTVVVCYCLIRCVVTEFFF